MSMEGIRQYINSVPDKRVALQLLGALDSLAPTKDDTALTAHAGGGQTNALVLRADRAFHDVTTVATAGDSVVLPNPHAGDFHFVKNSAALSMQVFAVSPGTIDSTATGTGVAQLAGDGVFYFCVVDGNYVRLGGVTSTEVFGTITADYLTMANPITYDHNTGITAFATGGQASATALTGEFNNVTTCATASDSVKLPAAVLGRSVVVRNSGAAALAVFPVTGDAINSLAANLSVDIAPKGQMTFRAIDATTYYTDEFLISQAPTTQKGSLVVKASDSAGNTVTTITNASQAAARTYTIPDAGADASLVLTEGTQTINGAKTVSNLSSFATAVEAAEHAAGAIGTGVAPKTYRWIEQGVIITQTKIDLEGLASVATANDVIGLAAGGAAYIGRNVVAINGIIFKVSFACLETPTGGDDDVNVVANASAVLAYDGAGGTTYLSNSGDLLAGQTIENLVPGLTANDYFYLTAGTGDTAATYTAGMYVLTTYGHPLLS